MNRSNVVQYFLDCYKSDTRSFVLNNFFSNAVEYGRIVSGEDVVLNGSVIRYPLTDKYGNMVQKHLTIYQKEKGFYLFSFFVIGSDTEVFGIKQQVCSPLFIHPAKLVEVNELFYLEVDFEKSFLNLNFISKLITKSSDGFFKEVNDAFKPGKIDFGAVGALKRILESYMEDVNCEELLNYPEMMTNKAIKAEMKTDFGQLEEDFKILPAIGYGVIKKSEQTRGLIDELNSLIANPNEHSRILNALLSNDWAKPDTLEFNRLPGKLSPAQQGVLQSVSKNLITQVTGPPGTGKSYTISALAVSLLGEGKSVLVTGKTNEAVAVVKNKIIENYDLEKVLVSSSSGRYRSKVVKYVENRLYKVSSGVKSTLQERLLAIQSKYDLISNALDSSTKELQESLDQEMKWGEYLSEERTGLFSKLKKKYIEWKMKQKKPYWELVDNLFENSDKLEAAFKRLITLRYEYFSEQSLKNNRYEYTLFKNALNSNNDQLKEDTFKKVDIEEILKTVSLWLCKASMINKVLPMRKEMFDVAIVDEASQSDIASILPVLQRAKRLVLVGDPKQLKHVSFLSRSYSYDLLSKYDLPEEDFELTYNYRDLSILDLVNNKIVDSSQVLFLNEHYRSNPDIIAYSNKEFYDNSLTLMTDHPSRRNIVSTKFVQTNGKRNTKGVNEIEAKNLISKLKILINTAEKNGEPAVRSIGILSPFRAQVRYISKQLVEHFSNALIRKYKIICGTAYSFQGEERDIMFLSMCVDGKSHSAAFTHLNKPDVFNVSITRAKHKQFVFLSLTGNDLKDSVFKDFLLNDWHIETAYEEPKLKGRFVKEVTRRLSDEGFNCQASFPLAGRCIDLLCQKEGSYFGINLIGYIGDYEDGHTIEELKLLYRSGIRVFPLPYSYWYFDQELCLEEIKSFVNNL